MKKCRILTLAATLLATALPATAQRQQLPNPDLTKGEEIPEEFTHHYNLGPTGARGWMYSHNLDTTKARQILVTEIADGSPADGVLQKDDVILGVFGEKFSYDPRTELGLAITRAEAGNGDLPLTVWRDGRENRVTLALESLGTYSDTAPFDCQKSARILAHGSKALAERMQQDDYEDDVNAITRSLNALALLATGNEEFMHLVRREAEWASNFTTDGFQTWWYPYPVMLMAEYQIATGDDAFEDGMRRLAMEAAEGQSIVGSWGHRFAMEDGRLGGYGMMNAPGIPLTISMHMARLAGLEDPLIEQAIDRSAKLIRFYAGKGAPPYGDHHPWTQTHEDNGKSGMAAVLFNFLEEEENAEFFARMSVASHGPERDTGHSGNFTNQVWAMPSVALSGPHATGGWMNEFGAWYFDLARSWDFSFPNPGPPQPRPCSFGGWDLTGGYLLAYAMPLEKILLTGKQPKIVPQIDADTTESLLRDGRGWSNNDRNSAYDSLDEDQLIERLASWSPVVRQRAAKALNRRGHQKLPMETLIEMLDSENIHARKGACAALEKARGAAAPAVDKLIEQLDHDDLWLRVLAADALAAIRGPARRAVPVLLDRIIAGPSEEDPRGMEQRFMIFAVFGEMFRNAPIEGVDPDKLGTAIMAGLQNQDGRARGAIGSFYEQLTDEQIEPLLPAIHEAIAKPAPSGIMFADGVRLAGLDLFARLRIEEGMQLALDIMDIQRWGKNYRIRRLIEIIGEYGGAAKPVLPQLRELEADLKAHHEARMLAENIENLGKLIESIENAPEADDLRSLN